MIDCILKNEHSDLTSSVIEYFDSENSRVGKDEYFPIFHFTEIANMRVNDFSEKLVNFFNRKGEQFAKKLENMQNMRVIKESCIETVGDLKNFLDDHRGKCNRSDMIFYYYDKGLIDRNVAKELLGNLKKSGLLECEYTAFRRAITYLPYKNYEE